jgi:NAD(P)-dependent dehydrogenase (short-subunit alcohol dehydrogenase family)
MADAFEGRDILVTGGTGALGTAVVGALLEHGAICHIPYIAAAEAERFPHRDHDRVRLSGPVDLADEAAVGRFYGGVKNLWASIHLAGGFAMAPIEQTGGRAFAAQIEMNLTSCFLCCRAAVAAMSASGTGGRIVNVAARPGLEPRFGAGMIAYATSKAGVAALTQALAQEVVDRDILVNAVAPSTLDTPGNRAAMPKADFSKWAKLDDVAATILFLASPENRVTRGAIVPVYGKS